LIWLLRHGAAEDEARDDASRSLTAEGVRQAEAAGSALAALGIRPEACFCSPKLRALQTARIACERLGVEVSSRQALRGGDFEPAELAAGYGEVLLVGHEPDFSRAVQATTGARVDIKKGGLVAIDGETMVSLLRPKEIEAIARVT
jgi:phosphohistidine phosphatase